MMRRFLRSWWFKVGGTVLLVGLLLVWVGPQRIWASLVGSDPRFLALGFVLTPVVIGVKTLRWWVLARTQSPISFWEALCSYVAGLTLATLTPLAAGEAGRGMFIRVGDRVGLTGRVILDKLIDLSAVGIFAGLGLVLAGEPATRNLGAVIAVGAVVAWGLALLLLPQLQGGVVFREEGWLARFRVPAVFDGLTSTPRRQLCLNMILSVIGFTVFYIQAFVLLLAFWPQATWTVIPYFPIITLSTILPIAIGGVGIREWTAILLLRQFGVVESVAFNASFAHFVVVQLLPAIAGAFIIGSFRREEGSRSAESEGETE